MGEFAFNVKNNVRQGYQRHHLIPVEVVSRTIIAPLISPLKNVGFDPQHFATKWSLVARLRRNRTADRVAFAPWAASTLQ